MTLILEGNVTLRGESEGKCLRGVSPLSRLHSSDGIVLVSQFDDGPCSAV